MIKRIRLQFFAVMAAIVFIIIALFCLGILFFTNSRNTESINNALDKMVSDFYTSKPITSFSDRLNNLRGFTVRMTLSYEIFEIRSNYYFTEEEIRTYIDQVKYIVKNNGTIDTLEYRIITFEREIIFVGLDTSIEKEMFNQLLTTVLLAGSSGTLALFIIIWFLSYWIVKPAATAFIRQKRFISEAGHEFKTPLTVISAGLELVKKSNDASTQEKWIRNIKEQTDKMTIMTADLLALSKIDEDKNIVIKTKFDLSQTVLTEALTFESVAYERGKRFIFEIDDDLICKSDPQSVRQAVRILCDNAIKHSDPYDSIKVQLKRQTSKISLSVSNTASKVNKEELPLLFERFYRGSDSRAETQGTGLGLSILKTLADRNGWKLDVDLSASEQAKISFTIII